MTEYEKKLEERIDELEQEVAMLKKKLSRRGVIGRPKDTELREYIRKCIGEGKPDKEIIGTKYNDTDVVKKSTFYLIKKELIYENLKFSES